MAHLLSISNGFRCILCYKVTTKKPTGSPWGISLFHGITMSQKYEKRSCNLLARFQAFKVFKATWRDRSYLVFNLTLLSTPCVSKLNFIAQQYYNRKTRKRKCVKAIKGTQLIRYYSQFNLGMQREIFYIYFINVALVT